MKDLDGGNGSAASGVLSCLQRAIVSGDPIRIDAGVGRGLTGTRCRSATGRAKRPLAMSTWSDRRSSW